MPLQDCFGRLRVDFRLNMQAACRINGQVEGATADPVNFELIQKDNLLQPNRALLDAKTGEFKILDVTPGDYKVRASQGNTRGEVTVHVGSADLDGVSIPLAASITINGSMRSVVDDETAGVARLAT